MTLTRAQSGLLAAILVLVAGCSGGGNSAPATGGSAGATATSAVAATPDPANDPTKNAQAPWNALAALGVVPVTIQSPPVVNFAVLDSKGNHVPGLKLAGADAACGGNNTKFMIAKYDGANWQSLIPAGTAAVPDPVAGATLEEKTRYYTYRFATNVAAAKDGATVHRIGIQLCFVDPSSGATVKVNPYLDFTVGADGIGVPVKDAQNNLAAIRKVVDRASCNTCHGDFSARHDAGLVDPNICVTCHNPGSKDYTYGSSLDFKVMVHKFHMGKDLTQDYRTGTVIARQTSSGTVTGIEYPQDARNCVACHDGSAAAVARTPNGDNWKTQASKAACFSCHDDYKSTTSRWYAAHQGATTIDRSNPDAAPDSACAGCHGDASPKINTAASHAIPEWELAAKYQYNIHNVTWNADRTVSVEFSVTNPVDGTAYDILGSQYRYTTTSSNGTTTRNFVFGGLGLLFGWGNGDYSNSGAVAATSWGTTCTTAVPSGSPTCNSTTGLPVATAGGSLVTRGRPVTVSVFDAVRVAGSDNRFKVTSTPVPTSASGTGVVALQGRISSQKDSASSYSVPVKNAVAYFAIGGTGTPVARRTVVSAEKCNGCHGKNINGHGHGSRRTEPEVCVICHNANNVLNGTTVVSGAVTVQPESADFRRMIHALHKSQAANYPAMPNASRTIPTSAGTYIGYTGVKNCTLCHVGDSYKTDLGVAGSSTVLAVDLSKDSTDAAITDTEPGNNPVISPKAAVCSSCHSDQTAKSHMVTVGGAAFGTVTQADIAAGKVSETCFNCHAAGTPAGVDVKHGLR